MDILLISSKCKTCFCHLNDTCIIYSSHCPRWCFIVWWLVLLCLYTMGISTRNSLLYVGLSLKYYVSYTNWNSINYIKLRTKLCVFRFSITDKILTRLYSLSNMVSVLKETGTAYPSWTLEITHSGFLVGSVLLILLVFCVVFFLCVLFVFVLNLVSRVSGLSISVWFSLTFTI